MTNYIRGMLVNHVHYKKYRHINEITATNKFFTSCSNAIGHYLSTNSGAGSLVDKKTHSSTLYVKCLPTVLRARVLVIKDAQFTLRKAIYRSIIEHAIG